MPDVIGSSVTWTVPGRIFDRNGSARPGGVGCTLGVGVPPVGVGPPSLLEIVSAVCAARSPVVEKLPLTSLPQASSVAVENVIGAVHRNEKVISPPAAAFDCVCV